MVNHVLILGCGRSGTSIFGELFDHFQGFDYYSEPYYHELKQLSFQQPVAIKVPTESDGYEPTRGLSFPLADLCDTIPDPKKIFWIVRHPLDAICSLKIGIANNWGHHPKPPDWQAWLQKPLVLRCAHHWNYINSVGYSQVADLAILKRFEDLIIAPERFATQVDKEVDADPEVHEQAIKLWAKRVQNSNNKHFVEAKTSQTYSRPDHSVRVDRWKENLTTEEVAMVLPIIQETATNMGYQDIQ